MQERGKIVCAVLTMIAVGFVILFTAPSAHEKSTETTETTESITEARITSEIASESVTEARKATTQRQTEAPTERVTEAKTEHKKEIELEIVEISAMLDDLCTSTFHPERYYFKGYKKVSKDWLCFCAEDGTRFENPEGHVTDFLAEGVGFAPAISADKLPKILELAKENGVEIC